MDRFGTRGGRLSGVFAVAAVALVLALTGCGSREPEDQAPLDIRGKPIVAAQVLTDADSTPASTNRPTGAPAPPPAHTTTLPATNPASAALAPDADGVIHVGFDTLAGYVYPETNEALPADAPPPPTQVPESLRVLSGQTVAVKGFMLPMKLQSGLATELLLMRDQSMCCFGVVPRINEWVNVKMAGRGVKPIQDQPVTIYGRFQVGEVYENGYLVTLYNLAGQRMETALDL